MPAEFGCALFIGLSEMFFEIFIVTFTCVIFLCVSVVGSTLYLAKVTERMTQNCNASLDSGRHLIAAENTTRPLENTFLNDSSLGVSISESGGVTKLPAFLESNPRMWLALPDSHFQTTQIEMSANTQILGESLKIEQALTVLAPRQLERMEDFILSRSETTTFSEFKQAVLKKFEISSEQKLDQLLNKYDSLTVRPSLMLRRLLRMATEELKLGEAVLRRIFLNKMPLHLQKQFTPMRDLSIDELAERAMKLTKPGIATTPARPHVLPDRPKPRPINVSNQSQRLIITLGPYASITAVTATMPVVVSHHALGRTEVSPLRETRLLQFGCTPGAVAKHAPSLIGSK